MNQLSRDFHRSRKRRGRHKGLIVLISTATAGCFTFVFAGIAPAVFMSIVAAIVAAGLSAPTGSRSKAMLESESDPWLGHNREFDDVVPSLEKRERMLYVEPFSENSAGSFIVRHD